MSLRCVNSGENPAIYTFYISILSDFSSVEASSI